MKNLYHLAFVHYNMRLKIHNLVDRTEDEDYYNPIDLSHIFEANDPIDTWIYEGEEPVLDGQDTNWLERELDKGGKQMGDNNNIRDEEFDEIYNEMHVKFYFDYISGVNEGAEYIHGVGSGNATTTGTTVRDDDDDTGGGGVGGTSKIGVNSGSCSFTEYDNHFISTEDTNHGIRPQEWSRKGKETQDHNGRRHGYGTYGNTDAVEERLR